MTHNSCRDKYNVCTQPHTRPITHMYMCIIVHCFICLYVCGWEAQHPGPCISTYTTFFDCFSSLL